MNFPCGIKRMRIERGMERERERKREDKLCHTLPENVLLAECFTIVSFLVIVLSHSIRRWLSLSLFQTDARQPKILSLPFSLLPRFNLSSIEAKRVMIHEDYVEGKTNFSEKRDEKASPLFPLISFLQISYIFNLWNKIFFLKYFFFF